jgi:hypothetical protein
MCSFLYYSVASPLDAYTSQPKNYKNHRLNTNDGQLNFTMVFA